MPNLGPTSYEFQFRMYLKQNKVVSLSSQISTIDSTMCQIEMANLIKL
jgi:hypothetical protein